MMGGNMGPQIEAKYMENGKEVKTKKKKDKKKKRRLIVDENKAREIIEKCILTDNKWICLMYNYAEDMTSINYMELTEDNNDIIAYDMNDKTNAWIIPEMHVTDEQVYECNDDLLRMEGIYYNEICIDKWKIMENDI